MGKLSWFSARYYYSHKGGTEINHGKLIILSGLLHTLDLGLDVKDGVISIMPRVKVRYQS